jgi:hypothetical protein
LELLEESLACLDQYQLPEDMTQGNQAFRSPEVFWKNQFDVANYSLPLEGCPEETG